MTVFGWALTKSCLVLVAGALLGLGCGVLYGEENPEKFDFKDRLPRVKPKEPKESLKSFTIAPGLRIQQVACEPLVRDPVDLAFDAGGRLWVVEMIGYSEREDQKLGQVRILDDIADDGPAANIFRTSPNEPWGVVRTAYRLAGHAAMIGEEHRGPSGYFTAACGITAYTGNAWPQEYHGNLFVCERAGAVLGELLDSRQPQAVLDPNRDVMPRYLNYIVVTEEGLSVTGMIDSETATSVTLKRAEGESNTVLRTNIDEMANSGLSIMPEGLEEQLTKQDMADLIAYLMQIQ